MSHTGSWKNAPEIPSEQTPTRATITGYIKGTSNIQQHYTPGSCDSAPHAVQKMTLCALKLHPVLINVV